MAYNTLSFLLVFLPLAWLLHVSIRARGRIFLGIVLGFVFIVWAGFLVMLWTGAILAWLLIFAWLITWIKRSGIRKSLMILAIGGLVGALFFAKYLLPGMMVIGLSFLIFFALSALLDIYRRPELNRFGALIAYISFFPKYLTGPIMPFHSFVEQSQPNAYNWELAHRGFVRLSFGLFKKLWIADPLGRVADQVFDSAFRSGAAVQWLGLLAFALQIFIDFSAYSDMAIGLGRIFGIELGENFNYPYMARSLRDFWRRWHISLGQWFRDYLFLPLAYVLVRHLPEHRILGRFRPDRLAAGFSMWLTMLLCGAWHGQSINFWIWGFYFGTLMLFESGRRKKRGLFSLLRTQLLVLFGWLIFRTPNPAELLRFLVSLWPGQSPVGIQLTLPLLITGGFITSLVASLCCVFPLLPALRALTKKRALVLGSLWRWLEPLFWIGMWLMSLAAISGASHRSFIYLKF